MCVRFLLKILEILKNLFSNQFYLEFKVFSITGNLELDKLKKMLKILKIAKIFHFSFLNIFSCNFKFLSNTGNFKL